MPFSKSNVKISTTENHPYLVIIEYGKTGSVQGMIQFSEEFKTTEEVKRLLHIIATEIANETHPKKNGFLV